MVSTPLRTNQPARSVYDFALSRLKKGEAPEDVKWRLVQEGLTEVEAGKVIVDLKMVMSDTKRQVARRSMIYGGLWLAGGLLVTGVSYLSAAAGDRYVLAWGAVLFGLVQIVRGALLRRD